MRASGLVSGVQTGTLTTIVTGLYVTTIDVIIPRVTPTDELVKVWIDTGGSFYGLLEAVRTYREATQTRVSCRYVQIGNAGASVLAIGWQAVRIGTIE